jgi:outer membrane lipoprotein-sorting protein
MPHPGPSSIALAALLALAACKPDAAGAAAPAALADTDTAAAPSTPAAATPATPAARSATDAVKAAMENFRNARTYHARMTMESARGTMVNELDFVAPDRFRMQMQGIGTQTVIGDRMWMDMRGRTMQVPVPPGTSQKWRDPANFEAAKADLAVEALGEEDIDGQPTRKYLTRHTQPKPGEVTLWIGRDDLPVQMRVQADDDTGKPTTVTVRYSRFDDPAIRIDPP